MARVSIQREALRFRSGLLLLTLVGVLFASVLRGDSLLARLGISLVYAVGLSVGAYLIGASRRWLVYYLTVSIPAIVMGVLSAALDSPKIVELGASALVVAAYATLVYLIFRFSLFDRDAVAADRVVAGICGYLAIALLWAELYDICEILAPGSFASNAGVENGTSFAEFTYFSLVTLTTLGYGDISPVRPLPRLLSALEAVTGTLYLAVFISTLVGSLRREPRA